MIHVRGKEVTLLNESILLSIKKMLLIDENNFTFDSDLVMYINSVLAVLSQLGVGSGYVLSISDAAETWNSLSQNEQLVSLLRPYIGMRVRLLFDPPINSFLVDSLNKQINEYEWRIVAITESENEE